MKTQDYRLLMLLMLGAVLIVGQLYVTLPMTSALASNWQVTTGQAAWAGSAFGFAYAAGFLLLGRLSDLHGRPRVLLLSLAATAVPGLIGTVASRATADFRARAMSLYTFFLFVGASIAPPVAQALAPHGWGALLWAPIAALLAAAAVVNGWSSRWPSVPQPSEHRIS